MNIKELTLYSNNLQEQKRFYTETLGFNLLIDSKDRLSVEIGKSILTFEHTDEDVKQYHFAFNIPSNAEHQALSWLKERVDIIKDDNSEIQYFDFWDAYAIYFYDADNNIAEFIARRTLNHESFEEFTEKSVLNICEIGTPTSDLNNVRETLLTEVKLSQYSGHETRFCSIGNENGLFICLNKEIKDFWYPTNEKTFSSDYKISFENESNTFEGEFKNDKLTVDRL